MCQNHVNGAFMVCIQKCKSDIAMWKNPEKGLSGIRSPRGRIEIKPTRVEQQWT